MRVSPEYPDFRRAYIAILTTIACIVSFAAEAQQTLPSPIPNLSGYDSVTRQSLELACISRKSEGPVPYASCLNEQIDLLKRGPAIPSLAEFDRETRASMELACISAKGKGPTRYAECLNGHIAAMKNSPAIPSLDGYDRETRSSMQLACISEKGRGPSAYAACLNRQIASLHGSSEIPVTKTDGDEIRQITSSNSTGAGLNRPELTGRSTTTSGAAISISRFTTDKVMKVHQGLSADEILKLFGPPKNISQGVCGNAVGKPWNCTTWEYEEPGVQATFTFSGNYGSLRLNNFRVNRD